MTGVGWAGPCPGSLPCLLLAWVVSLKRRLGNEGGGLTCYISLMLFGPLLHSNHTFKSHYQDMFLFCGVG